MLSSEDIHMSVMGQLSLNALRWYSLTSKAIYDEVQIFYQRNYSLNPILEPFIPSEHIPAFRRLQKENGLVISGSVALQFFTRITYPESDLDLYVEYACTFEVGTWLESEVGCTALDRHSEPRPFNLTFSWCISSGYLRGSLPSSGSWYTSLPGNRESVVLTDRAENVGGNYSFKGIRAVISFLSPINSRKIQLIICHRNVMEVILGFHSSMSFHTLSLRHLTDPYSRRHERDHSVLRLQSLW